MPYKTTVTLIKNSNVPFKQLIDENLANYLRQTFPEDNFLLTRKVLKSTENEWVGEITYNNESTYYAVHSDAYVNAVKTAWQTYNSVNGIEETTVNTTV